MITALFKKIQNFFIQPEDPLKKHKIRCYDDKFVNNSILESLSELSQTVEKLKQRVERLECESIENDNNIYELFNSLDAVDARIDIVTGEKFLREDEDV